METVILLCKKVLRVKLSTINEDAQQDTENNYALV